MTLETMMIDRLADWRTDSAASLSVKDEKTGWVIDLSAECSDVVGSRLEEVVLRRVSPPTEGEFGDRVAKIAGVATGLLEPLRLIEIDAERGEALLRSESPTQRDDRLFYYELLAQQNGTMSLRRYQGSYEPRSKREQVAYSLTHDALAKLVQDLTSAW